MVARRCLSSWRDTADRPGLEAQCLASAIGGVPIEILYDRMKTAVTGEDNDGHIIYNRPLLASKACI
ncbi:hypothetical protein CK224_25755 [Mesorhizobium sp. WSM3862]|nr:hypothetical protein CK224_25755 [Mesorhizobium sp. WSM3862]